MSNVVSISVFKDRKRGVISTEEEAAGWRAWANWKRENKRLMDERDGIRAPRQEQPRRPWPPLKPT
jgi:hypothetical protein